MKEVKKILICGGGMMGSAIAQVLAGLDDVTITVYDKFPVDIEAKIRNNMKLLVEKEIVTPADVDKVISKISFTQDIESEGVKSADLVVECVLEDMAAETGSVCTAGRYRFRRYDLLYKYIRLEPYRKFLQNANIKKDL